MEINMLREKMNKKQLSIQFLRENILKFNLPFMEERRNFFTFKQKKKFIKYLNNNFPHLEISLLEVGSKDGLCYNYQILNLLDNFYLEGIEPQKDEALKLLKSKKFPYKKIHTDAIFSEDCKKTLYVTKSRGCSSLYKPNFKELRKYEEAENFEIVKEEEVIVKKLDSIIQRNFDFINLDIQGSEYEALIGGKNLLEKCIGLSFECHLFELYEKQKLFSDIHSLIKDQFRILRFNTRTYHGLLFEIGDTVTIREMDFIKTKEDLIKNILYCVLWERREYIPVILRNKRGLLTSKDKNEICRILRIKE